MKHIFIFIFLRLKQVLKRAYKVFILLSVFLLILTLGIVGLKKYQSNTNVTANKVALVINDKNRITSILVEYLCNEESVKRICTFEICSEEEAQAKLGNNEIDSMVILPEDFVNNAIEGKNEPLRIINKSNKGLASNDYFRQLINDAACLIKDSQTAVYAVFALCRENNIEISNQDIDNICKKMALFILARKKVFTTEDVSATGEYGLMWFVIIAVSMLIMFFVQIPFLDLLQCDNKEYLRHMKMKNIPVCLYHISTTLGMVLINLAIFVTVTFLVDLMFDIYISATLIVGIFVSLWFVIEFEALIMECMGELSKTVFVTVFLVFAMMLGSGNLIPDIFLPKEIAGIAHIFPTYHIGNIIGTMTTKVADIQSIIVLFVIDTALLIISCVKINYSVKE